MEKKKGGLKSVILKIMLVAAILIMALSIGIGDYSHTKLNVGEFYKEKHPYEIEKAEEEYVAFVPNGADTGIIFYPGGNIEYTAYFELLDRFAQKGILTVSVHMPRNMPAFGWKQADAYIQKYDQIENWYIVGHDKGGTAAAKYVAKTGNDIEGIGLIASYARKDISDKEIKAVVMYGTSDAMISMMNYKKGLKKLPEGYEEVVIKGANHSYYGNYEINREDSVAKITRDQQLDAAADAILAMIRK